MLEAYSKACLCTGPTHFTHQHMHVTFTCDGPSNGLEKNALLFQVTYCLELAQFYMWAQTSEHIYIAIYLPTGAIPNTIATEPQCLQCHIMPAYAKRNDGT